MSERRLSPLVNPQFHLPQDILWYTFYFVVQLSVDQTRNVSKHSALNYLRRLSQVCVSWRELLLASSPLWGMALELDQLSQKTCHWRNEVLHRTGNSLLDIYCHISTEDMDVLDQFIKSLLDKHWRRIRNLSIKFYGVTLTAKAAKFMQELSISAFQKPAVNLESFLVYLGVYSRKIFITTRLFADHAPVLREYMGYSFRVNPHRPWFSKLRVLRITCLWTPHEFLATLSSMPLLENLVVNEDDNFEGAVCDPPVVERDSLAHAVLPQLRRLKVNLGMALAKHVAVLERLVPAPGLRFGLISGVLSVASADLVAVQRVLRSYLQLSFKNEPPHDLHIVMTKYYLLVSLSKDSRRFSFELKFDSNVRDITTILEPLTLIPLEYSTKLSIKVGGDIALDATDTALSRILLSSASIKELNVAVYGLNLLLFLSMSTDNILFPILELLELNGPHEVGPVLGFLSRRYTQEAPIQVLDFSEYQYEGAYDFRSLEQFNGLKVRWPGIDPGSTVEYTCGSGNAQVLDFSQEFPEP